MKNTTLDERVAHEWAAHLEGDVQGNSLRLKLRFPHVLHSPTMRRFEADFAAELNNLHGRQVLDLGCGSGQQSVRLLHAGARVVGVDLSPICVLQAEEACRNAGFDSSRWEFRAMDAHKLDLSDCRFAMVVGRGVLHHLDLPRAMAEIRRVLAPGGTALFQEPLSANPLLKLFRLLTPHARTVDERPLARSDLKLIEAGWRVSNRYYGLLSAPVAIATSLILRRYPANFLLRWADAAERQLNRRQLFQAFNQYVLLRLTRP